VEHIEEILTTVDVKVSRAMNEALLQPFNELEVRTALFQMGPVKAPGLDGFNVGFFPKKLGDCGSGCMPNYSFYFE
jgi:hypothetical protein